MLDFYSFFTHLVLFIDLFDYLFAYLFIYFNLSIYFIYDIWFESGYIFNESIS